MKNGLKSGIVGAGGFAAIAAKAFTKVKDIHIIAVTDIQTEAAQQLAQEINAVYL